MSDVKTSEHFYGQDEYHRSYFHKIDEPAPLKGDRVDPNLPDLNREKVVDPDNPSAPTRSGRDDKRGEDVEDEPENKTQVTRTRSSRTSGNK